MFYLTIFNVYLTNFDWQIERQSYKYKVTNTSQTEWHKTRSNEYMYHL